MSRLRQLLLASVAAACGGAPPPPGPTPAPVATHAAAPSEEPEPAVIAAPADIMARGSFPETPLTPLARQLISVTECALRGQPMPEVQFRIERHEAGDRLVRGAPIPAGDLHFLAFAMEIKVGLPNQKGLELMLLLTEHGVKILKLEAEEGQPSRPLPRWLPIDGLISEILRDVGRGTIDRWLVGEPEKSLVGPEIARELDKERPKPEQIAAAQRAVGSHSIATGYALDDIALVAKDGSGKLWGFKLQFEDGPDPELDARPLVRVRAPEER
jgi:hypothetical protein